MEKIVMLPGAKVRRFFRPTAMSLAMEAAGIIPGNHVVPDQRVTGVVRQMNDKRNERNSIHVAL